MKLPNRSGWPKESLLLKRALTYLSHFTLNGTRSAFGTFCSDGRFFSFGASGACTAALVLDDSIEIGATQIHTCRPDLAMADRHALHGADVESSRLSNIPLECLVNAAQSLVFGWQPDHAHVTVRGKAEAVLLDLVNPAWSRRRSFCG